MIQRALVLLFLLFPVVARAQVTSRRDTVRSGAWNLVGDLVMPVHRPAPLVLMLNKAAGTRFVYGELASVLASRGIASLRIDLRGHGESTNLGTFVPGDPSNPGGAIDDVFRLQECVKTLPGVDPAKIAILAGSYSAELAAQVARSAGYVRAYVALSPGNYSDSTFQAMDGSGADWLLLRSPNERFVGQWLDDALAMHSRRAELWISDANAAHASDILSADRAAARRIADWLTVRLRMGAPGEAAAAIARRLRELAFDSLGGTVWPADELAPRDANPSLGDGAAGHVMFFLAMHEFDPAGGWLADARRGGDFLLAALPATLARDSGFWSATGLHGGVAGIGVALRNLYRTTGDAMYADGVRRIIALLDGAAQRTGGTAAWGEGNDVLNGAAGTILFLLDADANMQRRGARELAAAAGRGLIARAERSPAGLRWKATTGAHYDLPNFSHGTAGVGFTLARLFGATGDSVFLRAALDAARHLQSVADTSGGGFLLFYGWPDPGWARPYDLGWAHGPAGTARHFDELHAVTGDTTWLQPRRRALAAIRSSGVPGRLQPRFGADSLGIDQRFGLAGMVPFLLDRPGSEDLARALVDHIVSRGTLENGMLWWERPRLGFMERPGEPARFTGYFYGSAGFGLALLRLEAALAGAPWPFRMPDEPTIG